MSASVSAITLVLQLALLLQDSNGNGGASSSSGRLVAAALQPKDGPPPYLYEKYGYRFKRKGPEVSAGRPKRSDHHSPTLTIELQTM